MCNTAILRLKYEVNGIVKNAYAIDIPTDDFDGNSAEIDLSNILEDIKASLREFFKFAPLALIAIVLIALINPIFTIIKFVFSAIVCVVEFFVSILTFPFRSSNK